MYECMYVCMCVCMYVCGYINFVVIIHIGIIMKCSTDAELVAHRFKNRQAVHYEVRLYIFDFRNKAIQVVLTKRLAINALVLCKCIDMSFIFNQ